jgi:hypothetical protein
MAGQTLLPMFAAILIQIRRLFRCTLPARVSKTRVTRRCSVGISAEFVSRYSRHHDLEDISERLLYFGIGFETQSYEDRVFKLGVRIWKPIESLTDPAQSSNWARTDEMNPLDDRIDAYLRRTGMIVKALVSGRKTATFATRLAEQNLPGSKVCAGPLSSSAR